MDPTATRGPRGALPLLLVSIVAVLVTFGFSRGFWISNAHNGLLALAFPRWAPTCSSKGLATAKVCCS